VIGETSEIKWGFPEYLKGGDSPSDWTKGPHSSRGEEAYRACEKGEDQRGVESVLALFRRWSIKRGIYSRKRRKNQPGGGVPRTQGSLKGGLSILL